MSHGLKILLRDINPDVAAAWREAFAGCEDVEALTNWPPTCPDVPDATH